MIAVVLMATLVLGGCGAQPQQFIVTGEGPDGCAFDGPDTVPAGEHEVMATPAGQGKITVRIFEGSEDGERVVRVSAEDQVDFAREIHDFTSGEYVVVCDYQESSHSVGRFRVTP